MRIKTILAIEKLISTREFGWLCYYESTCYSLISGRNGSEKNNDKKCGLNK